MAAGGIDALADATPASRDRYVDFLRAASILVVVVGHWLIAIIAWDGGVIRSTSAIGQAPGLWLATWVFQVMPVFFFVGGYANLVGFESSQRRGDTTGAFVRSRVRRLLVPAAALLVVWAVVQVVLHVTDTGASAGPSIAGVDLLRGVRPPGQTIPFGPLWFLGVYLVVVALAPPMVRLHRRFRLWVPATLAAVAAAVDAVRLAAGIHQVGYLNLLLVWVLAQQLGFFYADGTLERLSRRALAGLAAAGLAGLVALTGTGLYPPSMVGLPGDRSNMSPPTVCIVALTVWQLGLVVLARPRVSAWLARRGPWTAVIAVGSMAMTLYLWHLPAMAALYGLVLSVDGPLPNPGTGVWWATRPLWLAVLAAVLAPLALALSRFERSRRPAGPPSRTLETRTGRVAAVLGVALVSLGLLGFVSSGFTPLLDPHGSPLLVLRVDPLQNALHLVVGAALLGAARTGTADRPRPWLLAAVGGALPLALPSAAPVGVALHLAVAALALTVAATRRQRPAVRG
jgi:peptidoglycan/LPS O-acetylase OafA/YrhL